jgi:hypothetical protein
VLVGDVVRLLQDRRALRPRVGDAAVDVGHLEGDVDDPVAVAAVVVEHRAARVDPALHHEPDRPGAQHVGVVVAVAGLRTGVRDQLHAEHQLVVQRGLGRVAHRPHHRVPPGHRERVELRVVLDQADQLAQLVEVEVGQALLAGEGLLDGHGAQLLGSVYTEDTSPRTPSATASSGADRDAHSAPQNGR